MLHMPISFDTTALDRYHRTSKKKRSATGDRGDMTPLQDKDLVRDREHDLHDSTTAHTFIDTHHQAFVLPHNPIADKFSA